MSHNLSDFHARWKPLPGMPHLGSGITWESQGRHVMATPHLKDARDPQADAGDREDAEPRDGRYALVSVREDDGALIVYDAMTLAEVKRRPMRKPAGKYNVWNKITFSDGTSH